MNIIFILGCILTFVGLLLIVKYSIANKKIIQIKVLNKDLDKIQDRIASAKEEEFNIQKTFLLEYNQLQEQITRQKEKLSSGVKAVLDEQEKQNQILFYTLQISPEDREDILTLEQLKKDFNNSAVVSKLIWTVYYQKKVNELCTRLFRLKEPMGIYKITNIQTHQCYIGQSVNIKERFKQHCKNGCGANGLPTNKLYQDMLNNHLWNFSFELLEECSRDELNDKERKWIDLYQSNIYGLNMTKGGS